MFLQKKKKLNAVIIFIVFISGYSAFAQSTDGICDPALYKGKNLNSQTLEVLKQVCSKERVSISIRTVRNGDRVTITKTVNDVTTTQIIENVPKGYTANLNENGEIILTPPFQPSNETLARIGENFDWTKLNNDEKKELDQCIKIRSCNASAYKKGLEFRNFHSDSMELSACVASNDCDLEAYIISRNYRDFHDDALEFSECVMAKKCDVDAYKASRSFRDFRDDAFELSKCVAKQKCDLEAFELSRSERKFFDDAIEISKCVKSGECDIEVYLESIHDRAFHDDALENSKRFRLKRNSDQVDGNSNLGIE